MSSDPEGLIFENQIRRFLERVGFENVPRYGSDRETFELGGQEIDAFGRFDDLYVVIDAKTANSLRGRRGGMQSQLQFINGYRQGVINDIRQRYLASYGYRDCIFVLWTKNKQMETRHQSLARRLGIALRDEFDLKHYVKAMKQLDNPEIVRNGFLKDLALQLRRNLFHEGSPVDVEAIRTRTGGKTFHTFLIQVKHLLKFSYVFRIETNNILASYQRLLNPAKIRRIRRYLREDQGFFANNILVATDEPLRLTREDNTRSILPGRLTLPDKPCYLEIIDGQHRLLAYSNLTHLMNQCLSVTVISNLSSTERAKLFVLVNREQTKVPQYLLWDLYREIEPDRLRGKISNFVQTLNQRGPLKDLVRLPRLRSPRAYLSFANICQSLHRRTGLYSRYGENPSFSEILNTLFRVVQGDSNLGEDWSRSVESKGKKGFMCTNNALSIQIYLLSKILRKREEEGVPIPNPSGINTWRQYLADHIIRPFQDYLEENRESTTPDDPFGLLRKRTSNEAERSEVANSVFDQIEF